MSAASTRTTIVLAIALATAGARGDWVERRGSAPLLEGAVDVGAEGVRVRTDSGAAHAVPWDRVRRVHSDDDAVKTIVARYEQTAVDLWRARSRVERHDTQLAEPLLTRLFERYRGEDHETALVVAEGLTRCLLARGAHEEAVVPTLEMIRLRSLGVTTISYAALDRLHDDELGLCPQLVPWWPAGPALQRAERLVGDYHDALGAQSPVRDLAGLYRLAMRRQLGLDVSDLGVELSESSDADESAAARTPGVRFVALVLRAESPDRDVRSDARDALSGHLETLPVSWQEAWVRFARGVSLLRETGEGRQERGMLDLLHVPARWPHEVPYLSGLALARAADACEAAGLDAGAQSLRFDLVRRFAGHPIIDAPAGPNAAAAKSRN